MRYDAEHKSKTREQVLKAAIKTIRVDGPHRLGVADVMSQAGLTHGGFYAHFKSRDALLSAAIERMFADTSARWLHNAQARPDAAGLAGFIDNYLSIEHRDARAHGCPMPALASELPRLSPACRKAFAAGAQRLVETLAIRLDQLNYAEAETLARSIIAELVGAQALARSEPEDVRSAAMLAASRCSLKYRLDLEIHA